MENRKEMNIRQIELIVDAAGAEARGEYADFLSACNTGDAAFLGSVFSPLVQAGSWAKWKVLRLFGKKPPLKMVAMAHVKKAVAAAKALPPHVQIAIGGGVAMVGATAAVYIILKQKYPDLLRVLTAPLKDEADAELAAEAESLQQKNEELVAELRAARAEAEEAEARAEEAEARAEEAEQAVEDLNARLDEQGVALARLMEETGLAEKVEAAAEAVADASDAEVVEAAADAVADAADDAGEEEDEDDEGKDPSESAA